MAGLTLSEKLDQLDIRYQEMTQELSTPEIVSDSARFTDELVNWQREIRQEFRRSCQSRYRSIFLDAFDAPQPSFLDELKSGKHHILLDCRLSNQSVGNSAIARFPKMFVHRSARMGCAARSLAQTCHGG
jgi:hypothetical protein